VELGVDAQNLTGATHLYEKAGMQVKSRQIYYEKVLRPGFDLSTQSIIDSE
jgi:ribosomal protein S18 acetylase RimI-like enzyme